jgi:hypothetical protein
MLDQPLLRRWLVVGVQLDRLLKLSLLQIVAETSGHRAMNKPRSATS